MTVDRSFVELNRAATARMRTLAAGLTDAQWRTPVGQHWTVSIVYAHLAFTDGRARWVLDTSEREGKVVNPDYGVFINDVSLPFWAAIPPREAARLAIETAEAVDQRLESYPADLLEQIRAEYKRFLFRAYHRTEHLDEAEAALKQA
jgi:hypothetical protein